MRETSLPDAQPSKGRLIEKKFTVSLDRLRKSRWEEKKAYLGR
jgi:hypothetical protein